ncbi:hypothetical protein [uncultured Flavobacterium sp.]|uniref:hypothetical protein n=1 Tax=uncultured Flavobacterium sp. TaxID=165435 RepID=UPI0030ED5252|tara:strand:- start:99661 stop:101589 length:1929 start_codon:yes stop_codon:yes gene_type:complete
MKTKITVLYLLLFCNLANSQVKDISFTLSPFADYTFWDNKSGLNDGALVGGKLGFGFGEYIELRAIYAQSLNLKTNFNDFGIAGFSEDMFVSQDLKLTRWGGEIKANIGTGRLSPYITIGTGIQNIELDNNTDFDQIYANAAIGIKTKITDRIVFTLEGKNTAFNFNSGKNLLTEANKTALGVSDSDFSTERLYNWSANAGLQFYLGGRKPGTLTELDKAYLNKFKGGFKGLQIIFEPSVNYITFDDKSNFRDTYLIGGYAGLDFNQYTGVRAFFFRPTQDDQISTNLDRFSMYGLEFRARLNDGNGVTPYLILGGGYLNTLKGYEGKNGSNFDSQEFASAGLGLNIPLSKHILITGGARGMVTSGSNVEDLSSPDKLQTHIMYNAGLKLTFGKKSKNPNDVYNDQVDDALLIQDEESQKKYTEKSALQKEENDKLLTELKEGYQTKLDSLQTELEIAKTNNDVAKAVEVLKQKKETTNAIEEVKKVENIAKVTNETVIVPKSKDTLEVQKVIIKEVKATKVDASQPKELIKMSPAELEMLIDKILDKTDPVSKEKSSSNEIELLNKRIEVLEKKLQEKNTSATKKTAIEKPSTEPVKITRKVTLDTETGNITTEIIKSNTVKADKTIQKATIVKDSIKNNK